MSDQDSIFGGQPATQPQGEAPPAPAPANPWADKLAGIRNEQGEQKYADVDTALEALDASQKYIPQLHGKLDEKEKEIAELRHELAKQQGYHEARQEFHTPQQTQEPQAPAGLNAEQAADLFNQLVDRRDREAVRKKNVSEVTSSIAEKFGDKAEEVFYGKAKELGLSADAINDLAATSPTAVKELFGLTSKPNPETDVSAGSVVYKESMPDNEVRLGRNQGKSVLSGSTSRDVRAESQYVRDLVAKVHAEGGSIEDLTDPKMFHKYFGN